MKMVTDEQLINYSNLLFYYVKMLMESLNKLCNYPEQPTHWDFDRNTLIEGSLTHARTLIYFLLSKGDREGDIVCKVLFL